MKPERLEPLPAPSSGELVSIDKAALAAVYANLGAAVSAVERANVRVGKVRQLWGCVDAIFRSGVTPAGCKAVPVTP